MRAWLLSGFDGLSALHLGDPDDPRPAAHEALIDLEFASLNPADRYLAEGRYPARPPLPHILGRDGVGRVVAVGTDVKNVKPGDVALILRSEIGVTRPGTFAQRVCVPSESLAPVPPGWTHEEAAAAPLVYLTAYQALTQWGELPPGVVLITGASGGVGVASVHIAKALGHTVVALSRSADKSDRLRDIGADHTFDPQDPAWRKQFKAAIAPRRVDLAVDNIAGPLLPDVIDTMAEHGKVSLVGALAGPVPSFNTPSLFFRRLRLGGVAVGAYSPTESRRAWDTLLQLLARTGARPLIDSVFPFERLPDAFQRLAEGPMGKVLLDIRAAT